MPNPASSPPSAPDQAIDELSLADWRRRIADLYVDVRRLIGTDPDAAVALWRREREALFREHPQSPVPPEARDGFRAEHFPIDPALRFEVIVEPDDAPGAGPGASGGHDAPAGLSFAA